MSLSRPFSFHTREEEDSEGGSGRSAEELKRDRRLRWQTFLVEDSDAEDEYKQSEAVENKQQTVGENDESESRSEGGSNNDNSSNNVALDWRSSGINSLYMQRLLMAGNQGGNSTSLWGAQNNKNSNADTDDAMLPLSLPLSEWIDHYANSHQAAGALGSTFQWGMFKRAVDKGYLEKASRVALSLAKKLAKQFDNGVDGGSNDSSDEIRLFFEHDDICVENIIVDDTKKGDASFVNISGRGRHSILPKERAIIARLGRIYYKLFSQKDFPLSPSGSEQMHQQASTVEVGEASSAETGEASTFDNTLKISDECGENNDEDSGDEGRKQKLSRWSGESDDQRHNDLSCLPNSIRRLVSDMLENEECSGSSSGGGLFRHDEAVACLSDVVCDLQQMVDDPKLFLHDSLLMRWEPVIPDKQLYGRQNELQECMEIADALSKVTKENEPRPQSAIMISACAGTGKSSLMKEVSHRLETKGWHCIQCKFSKEVQPLHALSSAFDRFLLEHIFFNGSGEQDHDRVQEIRAQMTEVFGKGGGMEVLGQFVPSLRKLMSEGRCLQTQPNMTGPESKCRLHHLFGLLVKALSEHCRALCICLDDLHWSDASTIELIHSLIEGIDEYYINEDLSISTAGQSQVLFIGCFRSDEVAGSDSLAVSIKQMCTNLREIRLQGLSSEDVNAMVSDSLYYPRRLTRQLATLIHSKTLGNPLYIKEMINGLATENLLTYSLSKHRWHFDLELIDLKMVPDGVADLLTRRLQRLPKDVLSALQIMSCFGSSVKVEVLMLVRNIFCNSDIIAGLDCATKDSLLTKKQSKRGHCPVVSYRFNHDLIQNAVFAGIEPEERVLMLKELADSLIASTKAKSDSIILFIAADFIKRIGPANTNKARDRQRYASHSLLAGERAIPDYASSVVYFESGISFLDDDCWSHDHSYKLCLNLHENAAVVYLAMGNTSLMKKRVDAVMNNARCYDDKLDAMAVRINSLLMDGESVAKALNLTFEVLEHLGEKFPDQVDCISIERELATVKQLLPSNLNDLPTIEDANKIRTMHFLYLGIYLNHRLKNRYLPLVACRIVRLTLSHGFSEVTPLGLSGMAMSYAVMLKKYNEAYALGKLAVALASDRSPQVLPDVNLFVTGLVNVWKEPMQVAIPNMLDHYKIALKNGRVDIAVTNILFHCSMKFLSGSSTLTLLSGEMDVFLRTMSRHKRVTQYLFMMPMKNAISTLTGAPPSLVWEGVKGREEDDRNLYNALEMKEFLLAERIIIYKMMIAFIFRKYEEAENFVCQYHEFLEINNSSGPLNTIYRNFYTGIVAFNSLHGNNSKKTSWMDMGLKAMKNMETWAKECKWNFVNKLHLLRAEFFYAINDFSKAEEEYQLSIVAAHDHRFLHEKAIASERAGLLQRKLGMRDLSDSLLRQAHDCYRSWGAKKKADALMHFITSMD